MKYFPTLYLVLAFSTSVFGQPWHLKAEIAGMPDQRVYLASLKGEKETVIDSAASLDGAFSFPFDEHDVPGVYRILLGAGPNGGAYGRGVRSFDILFDHQDIDLKTDFTNLVRDMDVVRSVENQVYYRFVKIRSVYGAKFNAMYSLLNLYSASDPFYSGLADEFVHVQRELNDTLASLSGELPGTLASSLIRMYPEPVYDPRTDGPINGYMREHYFDLVRLDDPELINSPVYTQKDPHLPWVLPGTRPATGSTGTVVHPGRRKHHVSSGREPGR